VSDTPIGTPSSPLLAALMARTGGTPLLPQNSRYQGLPTRIWTARNGEQTIHLSRRLVPQPSRFVTIGMHRMADGERLDQVATSFLGDPLLAWRLADANGALDPAELERSGRTLRIPLPEGIPASNA
jgi:hypothetical protein